MFFTNPESTIFSTKFYVSFFQRAAKALQSDKQVNVEKQNKDIFVKKIRRFMYSEIVKTCDELDL